ncbi:MAG: hypothetical protein JRE63_03350 [Deltaproteobacteria bacterium]|jgi:hypothetical protein|nr:hypothetical protein [Deltaproteobacteria bacterium]
MAAINTVQQTHARTSERGIALILCIGFLAILSILGAVVLTATNNEIDQSWRERAEKDVFYTVDRAVEYALSPSVLADLVNPGDAEDLSRADIASEIALYYDPAHPKHDNWGTSIVPGDGYDPNNPDTWKSKVVYEGFGGNPSKADKYNKKIGAGKAFRYFHVTAQAQHNNPQIKETVSIDGELVQIFPTQSNTPITITSGNLEVTAGGN